MSDPKSYFLDRKTRLDGLSDEKRNALMEASSHAEDPEAWLDQRFASWHIAKRHGFDVKKVRENFPSYAKAAGFEDTSPTAVYNTISNWYNQQKDNVVKPKYKRKDAKWLASQTARTALTGYNEDFVLGGLAGLSGVVAQGGAKIRDAFGMEQLPEGENFFLDMQKLLLDSREGMSEHLGVDPEFEQKLIGQVARGGGQLAGMLMSGPFSLPAIGGMMYQEGYDDYMQTQERKGLEADPNDAFAYASTYMIAGTALERFGINTLIGTIFKKKGRMTWKTALKEITKAATSEGGTEAAQGFILDAMASVTYDDDRELFTEEAFKQRGMEFLVGAILSGGVSTVGQGYNLNKKRTLTENALRLGVNSPLSQEDFKVYKEHWKEDKVRQRIQDPTMQELFIRGMNGDMDAQNAYNAELVVKSPDFEADFEFGEGENKVIVGTWKGNKIVYDASGKSMRLNMDKEAHRNYLHHLEQAKAEEERIANLTDEERQELEAERERRKNLMGKRTKIVLMPDTGQPVPIGEAEATVKEDEEGGSYAIYDEDGGLIDRADTEEEAEKIALDWEMQEQDQLPIATEELAEFFRSMGRNVETHGKTKRTLKDEFEAGHISEKAAEEIIRSHGYTGDNVLGEMQNIYILGRDASGFVNNVWVDAAHIYNGATPFTVVEEMSEGYLKRMIHMDGEITLDQLREWKRQYEEFTGIVEYENTTRGMIEWFSNRSIDYVTMETLDGTQTMIPSSFKSFLIKLKLYLNHVMIRVGAMRKMKAEGKLDPELEMHLSRATLTDMRYVRDRMRRMEEEQINEELGRTEDNELMAHLRRVSLPSPNSKAAKGDPLRAELRDLYDNWPTMGKNGRLKVFRKKGDSLDDVRQRLNEEGFRFETVNDLLDAITASLENFHGYEGAQGVYPETDGQVDPTYMTAYHGTPHSFDRFDIGKIGTGEGAQAYGWGLYFAGNKEVAEHYKKTLGARAMASREELEKYFVPGDVVPARSGYDRVEAFHWNDGDWYVEVHRIDQDTRERVPGFEGRTRKHSTQPWVQELELKTGIKRGSLYQVDLKPSEDEYLLWDKPLSEQSEKVRGQSKKIVDAIPNYMLKDKTFTAGQWYERLSATAGGQENASMYLKSLGIRGIKYLDGSSRGKGEGDYNYVIFDDADVEIEQTFQAVKPYRDRSLEEAGEPLTPTEIDEGIEDESGTISQEEVDDELWDSAETTFQTIRPTVGNVPTIKRSDLKGKKKFIFFADRTRVGTYTGLDPESGIEIPLQGGPMYPFEADNQEKGAGWAFSSEGMFSRFNNRVNGGDGVGLVALYSPENLRANMTFLNAYVAEIKHSLKTKKITKKRFIEVINELRLAAYSAQKKGRPVIPRDSDAGKLFGKKWNSVEDFAKALGSTTFDVRAGMFFGYDGNKKGENKGSKIGADKLVSEGFPNLTTMVELFIDPRFKDATTGTIISAIQFEQGQEGSTRAADISIAEHASYPVVIRGKGIGVFEDPVRVSDVIQRPNKTRRQIERSAETSMAPITFQTVRKTLSEQTGIKPEDLYQSDQSPTEPLDEAFHRLRKEELQEILDRQPQVGRFTKVDEMDRSSDTYRKLNKVTDAVLAKRYLAPITSRLRRINPRLGSGLRKLERSINKRRQSDRMDVEAYMKGTRRFSKDEKAEWILAVNNGDTTTVNRINKKYGLEEEYEVVRKALKNIHDRAVKAGLEVGFRREYWPRIIKDLDGLQEFLYGDEEINGKIQEALMLAQANGPITQEDRIRIVNNLLIGYRPSGLNKPGNVKVRAIEQLESGHLKFYHDPLHALNAYLDNMNEAIEVRKFFGKSAKMEELDQVNLDGSKDTVQKLDLDGSVGQMVLDLIESGKISYQQQEEVMSIYRSRFSYQATPKAWATARSLGYLTAMGQVSSAITQFGDFAWAGYEAGIFHTLAAASRATVGRSKITREDVGIELIAQEFSTMGRLNKALDFVLTYSGLKYIDRVGKETLINASISRLQERAKAGVLSARDSSRLNAIFGEEAPQVMADLAAGEINENILLLAHNILLDYQPVSLSEMPQVYLDNPRGRVFYQLKTFTVKQLDAFRREGIDEMAKGNVRRGITQLVKLMGFFYLANFPVDWIKDWLYGREPDMTDVMVDNLWKLGGLSRYNLYFARENPNFMAVAKIIMPPAPYVEYPFNDARKAYDQISKGEDFEISKMDSWKMVPWFGKFYYWHEGKGADKIEKKRQRKLRE